MKFFLDFYAVEEEKIEFLLWAVHCLSMEPHLISTSLGQWISLFQQGTGRRQDFSGLPRVPAPRLFLAEPKGG